MIERASDDGHANTHRHTNRPGGEDATDSADDRPAAMFDDTERVLRIGHDRPIRISAGHRLRQHSGKCSRPHGHNYDITVSVRGVVSDNGWVVDKGAVTAVIEEWDHRFLLEDGDPLIDAFEQTGDGDAVVVLERPPTAEVMSIALERRLRDTLPETVSNVAVEIRETSELCAGYGGEPR